MEEIKNIVSKIGFIKKVNEAVNSNRLLCVSGASAGEIALCAFSLAKSVAICVSDMVDLQRYKECFEALNVGVSVLSCDMMPPIFSQFKDVSIKQEMIKNLYEFLLKKNRVLLVSSEALLFKFPKKIDTFDTVSFEVGKEYKQNEIIKKLIQNGYKKCSKVEKIGDFSIKGDIFDVFSGENDNPIRLDFFGDTLESIYTFDHETMQKIDNLECATIYPCVLYHLSEDEKDTIISNMKSALELSNLQGDVLIKNHTIVSGVIENLKEGLINDDEEFLRPFISDGFSIFDILRDYDVRVIVDEPKRILDDLQDQYKSVASDIFDYISSGELLPQHASYYYEPQEAMKFSPNLIFSSFEQKVFCADCTDRIRTIGSRKYTFDYKSLVNDINIYEKSKYKVILFAGTKQSADAIKDYLSKSGIYCSDNVSFITNKQQVVVFDKVFPLSVSFLDSGVVVIGTDDLIKKTENDVKKLSSKNKKRKVFYLPKVGDYVVHELHGIGKCIALEKLNFNGNEKDYFIIEYSGGDKLYLPSEQADLISAYVAGEGSPALNRIGGEQFARIKQRVKESVSKLAVNLLEIYSKREKTKGTVYNIDNNPLIDQFEDEFLYEETEDQISAINDIKNDMKSSKIMDRLICGDVGYGKTEVALRAIFNAIINGKQVAFLCPTTILSEQHYNTAKERFKNFPVNIAVLNRFRSASQQNEILKDLKDKKIDLIIGTHRLLSDDVKFNDLGLLILDEEQRFGVADKEKIKELKKDVDVLTLSATPIPRTLNMALTGIRDISIIETPPKERIAVHTFVSEESDSLILNACRKELARGGQVLYVFNRVEHIYEQEKRLRTLLPEARVGVAHGQMQRKELENTILRLYNKEYDILIATTLIESGIDLPLANTLIVIDADRLGLSELYQLKGRIGRSNRLAYAYFTYNPTRVLTQDAYKRLDAIMEFTELGSGFKIAMRDLEIRGAGNVLGKEQHGHLEKVGYDLYCKLLDSAIKELKGEKIKEIKPIKIDIETSANLSEKYVESEDDRINLYSQISTISTDEEYAKIYNILFETYGKPPVEAERLLKIAYIKNLAVNLGVKRVLISATKTMIYLYKVQEIMCKGLSVALSNTSNGVLKFEDVPIISFEMKFGDVDYKTDFMLKFLKEANANNV